MAVAAGVGLLVGLAVGSAMVARLASRQLGAVSQQFDKEVRGRAGDRNRLLQMFRRELANWLVRCDPDRYARVLSEARSAEAQIAEASSDDQRRQLAEITDRFKQYDDFDLAARWDWVTLGDGLSHLGLDEVADHYLTIVRFQALSRSLDPDWRDVIWQFPDLTDEQRSERCARYLQRLNDSRLKKRAMETMRYFRFYQAGGSAAGGMHMELENEAFSVRPVRHFAETRWGIHFKDTEEFA
ncbi:MAG TPA: hypothetical protein VN806_14940, partial [Caulobacteraceae bacterium]|nr:hypothetical protein [Caulobacteraceae bacterium]